MSTFLAASGTDICVTEDATPAFSNPYILCCIQAHLSYVCHMFYCAVAGESILTFCRQFVVPDCTVLIYSGATFWDMGCFVVLVLGLQVIQKFIHENAAPQPQAISSSTSHPGTYLGNLQ